MSLLIAQIALLMLVSALLGGVVAAWLVRRSLQALTDEQVRQHGAWTQWRQQIEQRLAERPEPDLAPLVQRLAALEKAVGGIRLPTPEPTNLRPVLDAVASIRLPEPPKPNLEPLNARLLQLEEAVKATAMPASMLAKEVELTALISRLGAIENQLSRLRMPDPVAAPNLQPLMASLLELQRAVAAIGTPAATAVDLAPVLQRLAQLQQAVEAVALRQATPAG